jgi:hypothetical protein
MSPCRTSHVLGEGMMPESAPVSLLKIGAPIAAVAAVAVSEGTAQDSKASFPTRGASGASCPRAFRSGTA